MAAKMKHRWLPSLRILLFLGFMLPVLPADLVSRCNEQCATVPTDDQVVDRDISCNQTCKINSCSSGCGLWDNTTPDTCNTACTSTFNSQLSQVQYCQSGCVYAEDIYAEEIIRLIGNASSPRVDDDSIAATSVSIDWDEAGHQGVQYIAQWRYSSVQNSAWVSYHAEPTFNFFANITDLRPYTRYAFRIQWVITPRHILSSPPSRNVTTDAQGVPGSPPIITNLLSPSSTTISVSWQPPQFPNGPLVSYTVTIEGPDGGPIRDDVADTVRSYTFVRLSGGTLYTVTVEANNMDSRGPPAEGTVTTLEELDVGGTPPYIVAGWTGLNLDNGLQESMVSFMEFEDLPDPSNVHIIEHENHTIQDVGVHYWKNLVIYSDTTGSIHRREVNVSNFQPYSAFNTTSDVIYQSGSAIPTVVDVDWLFDQIYFVQGDQILRCDLNCSDIEVAISDLDSPPTDVKVDPYHGYLYWSELGYGKGIFRVDLADTGSAYSGISPELVIEKDTIRSFVVDSFAYELFYSDETDHAIHGAFLDGRESQIIISATSHLRQPDFDAVNGMLYYNGRLTWTQHTNETGQCFFPNYPEFTVDRMYAHDGGTQYQETDPFPCAEAYHGLDMFHPSYQPYPIPPTPPLDLQVLFIDTEAELTWTEPQKLDATGRGVWEDWTYEVELTSTDSVITADSDSSEAARVPGLDASTAYSVRVRASSVGGNGPWSQVFNGTTLKTAPEGEAPYVLYSSGSDIVRVDLDGTDKATLISHQSTVRDIDWYDDMILWVDSSGGIYQADRFSPSQVTKLPIPQNAESLAIDWLGGGLYWGDMKLHKIFRLGLGSEQSSLAEEAYLSDAQDLAIDAINAYMYWTTAQSLECARLNGQDYFQYASKADFSGEQIAGLTLDLDEGDVYWFELTYVDGAQTLKLFRADMAGYSDNPASTVQEIATVNSITEQAALHYYSQKLLWIDDDDDIIISDLKGANLATPEKAASHALSIHQETLHPLPDGFDAPPNVIPSTIPSDSVAIDGSWDDFSITWNASSEVTYGDVLYEINVVAADGQTFSDILSDPSYNIQDLAPYTDLAISLIAYTYWAYTEPITVNMKSPESVPIMPLNARVYIMEEKDVKTGTSVLSADVRWEAVAETNGVLRGYTVYWGKMNDDVLQTVTTEPDTTKYTIEGLETQAVYYFKVEGFTDVGSGPPTELLNASTTVVSPPPTLFALSPSGAAMQMDVDSDESMALLGRASISAVAMVFDAESDALYWLDEDDQKLKTSPMYEDRIEDLAGVGSSSLGPSSLCINYVTKQLYWPEETGIFMYDTQTAEKTTLVELEEGSSAYSIVVNPLTSSLIWTESDGNTTNLMTSDLNGIRPRNFFPGSSRRGRQACNCPSSLSSDSPLAFDLSDPANVKVYFLSAAGLMVTDSDGCMCDTVNTYDTTPESLTVDGKRLYWTTADNLIASVDKSTYNDFQSQADDAMFVIAFGDNLQPFPDPECLVPEAYNQFAQLESSTSTSLTLNLYEATSPQQCSDIQLATPMYTVYYKAQEENATSEFQQITTTSLTVELPGLEPYTYYTVEVSVSNLYTIGDQPHGPDSQFRTAEGVPSVAQNLDIEVLTSSQVKATWSQPEVPNGDPSNLRFRVEYKPTDDTEATRMTNFGNVRQDNEMTYSIAIIGLTTAKTYQFLVQSYTETNDDFSSTDAVVKTTFPKPNPVQQVTDDTTHDTLAVIWEPPSDKSIIRHSIQYAEAGSVSEPKPLPNGQETWESTDEEETGNSTVDAVIDDLRPYTYYHLRAYITYQSGQPYVYESNDDIIQTYETDAYIPDVPLLPVVNELDNKVYEVTWKEVSANGPGELSYVLQAAKKDTDNWSTVYKGANLFWRVNLTAEVTYRFQVAGLRSDGSQGEFSLASNDIFIVAPPVPQAGFDMTIIYAAVAGALILIIVIIIAVFCVVRSKRADKPMEGGMQVHYAPDQELATLRNMSTSVVNRDNTLYAVTTTANGAEVELPIFPRERLKLVTFLGSGAFGEVFEGLATDINGAGTGDTRVAVKTLRKGATDEEKDEFLKEAALMGNFQNENVLALLGVCLDNDPQFIILELMEGGDLLTYIRGARATSATPARLGPNDLTDIVLDVAKGCAYLESIKFIHRDLAARNCLVTTKDYAGPNVDRTVKIGDFGLARDVYKSDYYRKEGEGLLPVRWMSPEALVDGVFTTQSDVWSFGVLCWEVMTLGQQPYPARNNLDVLQFVTAGGRLSRPDNCPYDIHHIMLKCWEQSADARPTFRNIVERMESYKRNSQVGGVDNFGYETSVGMNVKYARLQDPNMQEYLLPMDSAQSLSDPTVPGDLPPSPLPRDPNEDIRRQKAANAAASAPSGKGSGARPKKKEKNDNSRRSTPRRPALDEAVENMQSPKDKCLEPRYHAFPPKGSWSKAVGKKARKAPPIPDDGPPLDAPGRPKKQHGPMIDPEEVQGNNNNSVLAAAAAVGSDDTPPALKPRRHPNPFRKDLFDEKKDHQYVNIPEDSEVNAFANV